MKRDHSDSEIVEEALRLDRERHAEPWQWGWMVAAILAAWFLLGVTVSLALKVWGLLHG